MDGELGQGAWQCSSRKLGRSPRMWGKACAPSRTSGGAPQNTPAVCRAHSALRPPKSAHCSSPKRGGTCMNTRERDRGGGNEDMVTTGVCRGGSERGVQMVHFSPFSFPRPTKAVAMLHMQGLKAAVSTGRSTFARCCLDLPSSRFRAPRASPKPSRFPSPICTNSLCALPHCAHSTPSLCALTHRVH